MVIMEEVMEETEAIAVEEVEESTPGRWEDLVHQAPAVTRLILSL